MKRLFRRVRRVIDFLPNIWKGEDYDYYYSLQLFKYQLERTADYIEERGMIVDAPHVASRLRTAAKLMDRVYNDYYIVTVDWDDEEGLDKALKQDAKAERILWKFIAHNIRHWWD